MSSDIELFAPDVFSDPEMKWQRCDDDLIIGLIKRFFDSHLASIKPPDEIFVSGGLELNSRNALILSEGKEFVLKRLELGDYKKAQYLELIDKRFSKLVSFLPKIIKNSEANRVTEFEGSLFILYEKKGDRHFQGGRQQLSIFLERYKNLLIAAKKVNPNKFTMHPYIERHALRKFEALEKKIRSRGEAVNDQNISVLLANSSTLKQKLFECCSSIRPARSQWPCYPLHIDLHPHNITVDGDQLFFVDLDSVQVTTIPRSLGFALYKLTRQSVVAGHALTDVKHVFSDRELLSIFCTDNLNSHDLKQGASIEIVRRLMIVINEMLLYESSEWSFTIPMHIRALKEIQLIFPEK